MNHLSVNRIKYFFALIFFISCHAFSQNDSIDNALWINASPFALIDGVGGTSIRIGAETRLYKNIAVGVDYGQYINYLKTFGIKPSVTNLKGYQLRPTIKYYFNKEKHLSGKYLGIEYQFKRLNYTLNDSIKFDELKYAKKYRMRRQVNSVSIKYGEVTNFGKNWILEWYAGLGVRYIYSKAYLSDEEYQNIETTVGASDGDGDTFHESQRKRGNFAAPNILLGLKIGYRLK